MHCDSLFVPARNGSGNLPETLDIVHVFMVVKHFCLLDKKKEIFSIGLRSQEEDGKCDCKWFSDVEEFVDKV